MRPSDVPHRARIVVFDPNPDDGWARDFSEAMRSDDLELVVPASAERADAELAAADILIATGRRRVDASVIARLERAVGIVCLSVGTDQVDLGAATTAGIDVTNVPDYCTQEVADHAMALLLAAERRLFPIITATKAGVWNQGSTKEVGSLRRLRGRTLGLIGAGRIGRLIGARARAFGFETIAYDPAIPAWNDGLLESVDLDTLARRADALVVCAALTPDSHHLVGRQLLDRVKPGLVLVNVARGGLVDERALAAAIDAGRVAVAALDVRETEPPDPASDPLAGRDNVLVTPHLGGTSIEAFEDLLHHAASRSRELLLRAGRVSQLEGVSA